MAKARSILKRVKAVKSTRTITKTMEMISTARFKKTHDRVVAAKPYTQRLSSVAADLAEGAAGELSHPLLVSDEAMQAGRLHQNVQPHVLIIITANRGLCGSYNSAVLRLAMERLEQLKAAGKDVLLYVVGKRGLSVLKFRKYAIAHSFTDFDYQVDYGRVSDLADDLMAQFIEKKIGGVDVVYTQFISSGRQKGDILQLLPLSIGDHGKAGADLKDEPSVRAKPADKHMRPLFEYLPSRRDVLEKLLPASVKMKLFQCFLDAAVSEQIARMTAMRAATENADEMIHDLTVRYNRMRQSQITTELAEIMGGRAGLEQ